MITWLLISLFIHANICMLFAAFLIGSMRKRDIWWAAGLATLAAATILLLVLESVESLSLVFPFNPIRVAKRVWETSDYISIIKGMIAGVLVPVLGSGVIFGVLKKSVTSRAPALSLFLGTFLTALLFATIFAKPSVSVPLSDNSSKIKVPAGFSITPFLPEGLYRPTSIVFDSNDRLFVASRNGVVNVIEDSNGDGTGDTVNLYGHKDGMALGLALTDDDRTLLVSGGGSVVRIDDSDADGKADSTSIIIDGLPSFVYDGHSNNGIAVGQDKLLYITLGGISDHGPDNHPLAGSILTSDLNGDDLRIYASGLRNPYDLAFRSDGSIVATDNGPDYKDNTLSWDPPDELNLIVASGDYGYPNFFGYPPAWSETSGPVAMFPSHSVPTGVAEYRGREFPSEYDGIIFVSLFGPFVNPRFEGHVSPKVVMVTLSEKSNQVYTSTVKDFAHGFVAPIDVAVDSLGRLYVADYGGHQVYRINWESSQNR